MTHEFLVLGQVSVYVIKLYIISTFYFTLTDIPEVTVRLKSPSRVIEGATAKLECEVTDANPNTNIIWEWFKTNTDMNLPHGQPIYIVPNIMRSNSGTYSCAARNSVGISKFATIYVDVLCKYFIRAKLCWRPIVISLSVRLSVRDHLSRA